MVFTGGRDTIVTVNIRGSMQGYEDDHPDAMNGSLAYSLAQALVTDTSPFIKVMGQKVTVPASGNRILKFNSGDPDSEITDVLGNPSNIEYLTLLLIRNLSTSGTLRLVRYSSGQLAFMTGATSESILIPPQGFFMIGGPGLPFTMFTGGADYIQLTNTTGSAINAEVIVVGGWPT